MSKLQLQDLDAVCVVFKRVLFVTQFHLIASLAPTLPFEAAGGRILAAGWQLGEPSNWNNNECLHYHSPCCCYCPCSPPSICLQLHAYLIQFLQFICNLADAGVFCFLSL